MQNTYSNIGNSIEVRNFNEKDTSSFGSHHGYLEVKGIGEEDSSGFGNSMKVKNFNEKDTSGFGIQPGYLEVTDFGEKDSSGFGNYIEVTDFDEKDKSGSDKGNNNVPTMPISAYQWLDNDLSSNPEYFPLIKGYYDYIKLEGGKEAVLEYLYGYQEIPGWYTDVDIAKDFARFELTGTVKPIERKLKKEEEVSLWDVLDEDISLIKPALESIANGKVIEGTEDVISIARSILNGKENNGGLINEKHWLLREAPLSNNPIYTTEIDGNYVEMEVLTVRSTKPFGGEGTEDQTFFENVKKLAELLADPPKTFKEVGATVVGEIMSIFGEEMSDYYNPGSTLQENDVRISIELAEDVGTGYMYDYFFRDGQLMYVLYNGGTEWINEEFFNEDK
jgi:hypothetical protein